MGTDNDSVEWAMIAFFLPHSIRTPELGALFLSRVIMEEIDSVSAEPHPNLIPPLRREVGRDNDQMWESRQWLLFVSWRGVNISQ